MHELLRYHIKDRKAVLDYRGQLLIESLNNEVGKRISVELLRTAPTPLLKLFVCSVKVRREGALRNRSDLLYHIGDHAGILNDDLISRFLAEI